MSSKPGISSSVYCFGSGEFNQTAQQSDVDSPILVLKDSNVEKIFAGGWHSATLSIDGDLMTWGRINTIKTTGHTSNLFEEASISSRSSEESTENNSHENNISSHNNSNSSSTAALSVPPPTPSVVTTALANTFNQMPTLAQSEVKNVALIDYHTIIMDQNNYVHVFTHDNQVIPVSNVTHVFGHDKTVIIFQESKITVFSPNKSFQNMKFELPQSELPVSAAITLNSIAILSDQQNMYIYSTHPNKQQTNNSNNNSNNNNNNSNNTNNDEVEIIKINDIVSVAASNDRFIILKPNGRVYETYSNGGKRQICGINGNPISLFAGGAHYGCVTFEGECWTWGAGTKGQLGNSSFTNSYQPKKVIMKEDMRIIAAAAGEEHTILLAVKDASFVPVLPEPMKKNEYMKMLRMDAAIPAAFVASEFDSKF